MGTGGSRKAVIQVIGWRCPSSSNYMQHFWDIMESLCNQYSTRIALQHQRRLPWPCSTSVLPLTPSTDAGSQCNLLPRAHRIALPIRWFMIWLARRSMFINTTTHGFTLLRLISNQLTPTWWYWWLTIWSALPIHVQSSYPHVLPSAILRNKAWPSYVAWLHVLKLISSTFSHVADFSSLAAVDWSICIEKVRLLGSPDVANADWSLMAIEPLHMTCKHTRMR